MALPPLEDNEAGWLAAIGLLASVLWKVWLRLRHDTREDSSGAREHAAQGDVITLLREEVERLAASVTKLSEELNEERRLRYETERRAAALQDRVDALERRLRGLGHTP